MELDISRPRSSRHFNLKAGLMWTMHDSARYNDCFGKNSNYLSTLILLVILIITVDLIILSFIYILIGLKTSSKDECAHSPLMAKLDTSLLRTASPPIH